MTFRFKQKFKEAEEKWMYYRYKNMNQSRYPEALKRMFYNRCHYKLNLEHPRTFNEKIQWLKLYDTTEEKTILSDKYRVREWIKEKLGEQYLIPIIGEWDRFEDIDFSLLPNQFVLKTNHGSGYIMIIKNKEMCNYTEMAKQIKKWMNENFAFKCGFELQYLNIKPKIIIEEYLEDVENNLYDYKIHCFSGKPEFIQIIGDRDIIKHTAKELFVDIEWNPMECTYTYKRYEAPEQIVKPAQLDKMLDTAVQLSHGFKYVRVDLYCLKNNMIKFGELTFTPASGFDCWNPKEFDKKWGELIKI